MNEEEQVKKMLRDTHWSVFGCCSWDDIWQPNSGEPMPTGWAENEEEFMRSGYVSHEDYRKVVEELVRLRIERL